MCATNVDPRSRISWDTAIGSGWVTLLLMNTSRVPSSPGDIVVKEPRDLEARGRKISYWGAIEGSAYTGNIQ